MRLRLGPLGAPVAIVLAWVGVRIAVLLPVPEGVPALRPVSTPPLASSASLPAPARFAEHDIAAPTAPARRYADPAAPRVGRTRYRQTVLATALTASPAHIEQVTPGPINPGRAPPAFRGRSGIVAGYAPRPPTHRAFTGSGWALVNGTGGAVGVPSLGGSQTGVRLFLQGESAPLALTARVSRALGAARDTEISAGYALRARELGLLVERRQRLDAKSGAFAVTGYGGVYDVRLPAGLRFDGFAQGGVAGLRRRRWFADGQARVTGRAALSPSLSLGAGGGAWASAQQGARRVEAGPLIEAPMSAFDKTVEVAGEYRFRITSDATPRSGPALTIGVDF